MNQLVNKLSNRGYACVIKSIVDEFTITLSDHDVRTTQDSHCLLYTSDAADD